RADAGRRRPTPSNSSLASRRGRREREETPRRGEVPYSAPFGRIHLGAPPAATITSRGEWTEPKHGTRTGTGARPRVDRATLQVVRWPSAGSNSLQIFYGGPFAS